MFGVKIRNTKLCLYVNYISWLQLAQDMIQWLILLLRRRIISKPAVAKLAFQERNYSTDLFSYNFL
jgi:hypothetical protein